MNTPTHWMVCVWGGSCQQSLSDCILCAHYSVSMCRHTYVNQRRVHDSCCYKHTPHSCRLHVHKHLAHSTLVESQTLLFSALYTQIPFLNMLFLQQGSSRSATHTVWSETWYNVEQCYILNASTFSYTASHTPSPHIHNLTCTASSHSTFHYHIYSHIHDTTLMR